MRGARFLSAPFGWWILGLLGLDLLRSAWIVSYGPEIPTADAAEYWHLGASVAQGDWLLRQTPIAYRTPGYPWLLGIVQATVGPQALWGLVVVQGAMLTLTSGCTAAIVWWMTSHRGAVILSLGLNLLAISRSTFITVALTETFFTMLLVVHLACCVRWSQSGRHRWAAAVGLSLAAAILVRPIAMYLSAVHLLALAAKWGHAAKRGQDSFPRATGRYSLRDWPRRVWALAIMAACLVLPMLPWMHRNEQVFGRPLVTEFLGRNLWIVTYQGGAGAGLPLPASPAAERLRRAVSRAPQSVDLSRTWQVSRALGAAGLNDAELDRLMRDVALQSIRSHPLRWSMMAARRLVNFWRCVSNELPLLGNSAPSSSLAWNSVLALAVLAGGLTAVLHPRHRGWAIWMLLVAGYFSAVTALVEIPDYRYRLVVEPLMIAIAGLGLASLQDLSFHRRFIGTGEHASD